MCFIPSRLALALAVLSAVPAAAPAQQPPTQKPQLHARHWIAITGKPLGATAGAMMFARGGNAVDAACAMLAAVAHVSTKYGRRSQVSVERVMGCGMGGCYSCVISVKDKTGGHHYVRSCIGGPVFNGADLVWD